MTAAAATGSTPAPPVKIPKVNTHTGCLTVPSLHGVNSIFVPSIHKQNLKWIQLFSAHNVCFVHHYFLLQLFLPSFTSRQHEGMLIPRTMYHYLTLSIFIFIHFKHLPFNKWKERRRIDPPLILLMIIFCYVFFVQYLRTFSQLEAIYVRNLISLFPHPCKELCQLFPDILISFCVHTFDPWISLFKYRFFNTKKLGIMISVDYVVSVISLIKHLHRWYSPALHTALTLTHLSLIQLWIVALNQLY